MTCLIFNLILAFQIVTPIISFKIIKDADCTFDLSTNLTTPLLYNPEANELFYPQKKGDNFITIPNGKNLEFLCPGNSISGSTSPSLISKCQNGQLLPNGQSGLSCTKEPFHTARFTNHTCESNGSEVEIGYLISTDRFIRQIKICFDPKSQNTLYSHYNLTKFIGAEQSKIPRPYFIQDPGFYHLPTALNTLYSRKNQRKTINGLLGLPADSTKFIQNGMNYFLARGHFTAKADFVYASQQRSTFHYINTAPQWQIFNAGNWVKVEESTRQLASDRNLDLRVYTGSYGVCTLPNAQTGKPVGLYLSVNGNQDFIASPKLYWKVVYDPISKAGVALVGVNNPFISNIGDNVVCQEVTDKVTWVDWDPKNFTLGYSYACDVDELRKTVKHLPVLDIKTLLV